MTAPVKENWVANQLKSRETEFANTKPLKLFCGTWNVNGKLVVEDIAPWLLGSSDADAQFTKESCPDVFAVGVQELDTSAEAFLLNDSPREDYWTVCMENGFKHLAGLYTKLTSKQLVGMLIVVFVRRTLVKHITDVSTSSAGCGIMGMMGNKGGVAVRFKLHDSYLCFVNSHLAASSLAVDRRNQDYLEIGKRLAFTTLSAGSKTIWDCDSLIWFGDLNYRIPLPELECKEMLKTNSIASIVEFDQLNTERKLKRAFAEFTEAPITFQPSYKYDPGTNTFDTSEKRRTPSWCDRVLWRRGDPIVALNYQSCMSMMTSDHKPVFALLKVNVKLVDPKKWAVVHQSVLRDLDKFENDSMPDALVSTNHLEFVDVVYLKPQTHSVVLENVGQVLAQFRFIPKLDDKTFCKPWLYVNPPMSMLLPGEKIHVNFTVMVDHNIASSMNSGEEKIEDILILHLENGKDYFISISGNYLPTCFAVPLENLVRQTLPVRSSVSADPTQANSPLSIPKELWRIVDYLFHFGLAVGNLFLTSGDPAMMERIRECLDTGAEFPTIQTLAEEAGSQPVSPVRSISSTYSRPQKIITAQDRHILFVHSMAETLIRFLEALPDPVIPFTNYQRCLDAYGTYEVAKNVVASLPNVHYNAFVYVTSFLREIISTYESSGSIHSGRGNTVNEDDITKEKIAMVFASVLLHSAKPVAEKYADLVTRKKTAFIMHFLHTDASELTLQK